MLIEDSAVPSGDERTRRPTVRVLTLHRPKQRNALDSALLQRLILALESAERDDAVRAVVLAGAGPVFCAGGDVKEFADRPDARQAALRRARLLTQLLLLLPSMSTPVVAAVAGPAVGGGAALVLAADVIVAGDDFALRYPEITDAVVPAGVMPSAIRHLGPKLAFEMLTQGRELDAAAALARGLVSRVVATDQTVKAAVEQAYAWARLDAQVVAESKRLFYRVADLPLEAGFQTGLDVTAATWKPRR